MLWRVAVDYTFGFASSRHMESWVQHIWDLQEAFTLSWIHFCPHASPSSDCLLLVSSKSHFGNFFLYKPSWSPLQAPWLAVLGPAKALCILYYNCPFACWSPCGLWFTWRQRPFLMHRALLTWPQWSLTHGRPSCWCGEQIHVSDFLLHGKSSTMTRDKISITFQISHI